MLCLTELILKLVNRHKTVQTLNKKHSTGERRQGKSHQPSPEEPVTCALSRSFSHASYVGHRSFSHVPFLLSWIVSSAWLTNYLHIHNKLYLTNGGATFFSSPLIVEMATSDFATNAYHRYSNLRLRRLEYLCAYQEYIRDISYVLLRLHIYQDDVLAAMEDGVATRY